MARTEQKVAWLRRWFGYSVLKRTLLCRETVDTSRSFEELLKLLRMFGLNRVTALYWALSEWLVLYDVSTSKSVVTKLAMPLTAVDLDPYQLNCKQNKLVYLFGRC